MAAGGTGFGLVGFVHLRQLIYIIRSPQMIPYDVPGRGQTMTICDVSSPSAFYCSSVSIDMDQELSLA